MKKNLLPTLFSFYFLMSITNYSIGQTYIDSYDLGIYSKEELSEEYDVETFFDLQLYKILYETPDIHGVTDTASGLLLLPIADGGIFPLLNYQHGTVDNRTDVPSNLEGGYELAAVLASQGYITVAPDYLGLGEARGIHPYVHADTEASAAIDMMHATRQFVSMDPSISLNEQVFVSGYSQGGHAAMAAHRAMELDPENNFIVTAAAPMSGPYSISEKMRDFTMGDEVYVFAGYLVATTLSFNEAYGNIYDDLNEFYKPQYIPLIESYINEEIGLFNLTFALLGLLEDDGGWFLKNMLQDSIQEIILSGSFPDHPINVALRANDVYDWAPTAPTRIFYCTSDDQVTFENSILADEVMNANGASDVAAIDVGPSFDHGACVPPATAATIEFFAGFQSFFTNVDQIDADQVFSIQPNPADDYLLVNKSEFDWNNATLRLMDSNGRLIRTDILPNDSQVRLDVSTLSPGMYFVNIVLDKGTATRKIIIN